MKTKILLCSLFLLARATAFAQYTVTVSSAPYEAVDFATELTYSAADEGYYFPVDFMFRTFDNAYANCNYQRSDPASAGLFMSDDGYVAIYDSIGKKSIVVFQCFENAKFQTVPGMTSAWVELEGEEGVRILKMEWRNLVYDGIHRHTASFQVWLHEADGSISYHYGRNSVPPSMGIDDGGQTGIIVISDDFTRLTDEINLEGKPSAPVIYRDITTFALPTLDTLPAANRVYTFKRSTTAINAVAAAAAFDLYPNPAKNSLVLKGDLAGATVQIFNYSGQLVLRTAPDAQQAIDITALPKGWYTLRLLSREGVSASREFIKE
jgi:hypothetical protein